MPRTALVFDAHDYESDAHSCACEDGHEHAPCAVCGSAKDAFIHEEEAKTSGALLTVVSDVEVGKASEGSSKGA
jgi:hypothetical protein